MPPFWVPAVFHLFYFGWLLPYRTWRGRNVWPRPEQRPPRVEHYKTHIIGFLSHGLISLTVLPFLSRSARNALFPAAWPDAWDWLLGAIALAVMVAIDLAYSRRCFDRDDPHMYFSSPQTRQEQLTWIAHSSTAAITEELTWRGVQPGIITQMTGQPLLAVAICAATFGIGHVRHGKPFILIAGLFALGFHALTWLTGALYVPMLVHIGVNVIVGLAAGRWVRSNRRG